MYDFYGDSILFSCNCYRVITNKEKFCGINLSVCCSFCQLQIQCFVPYYHAGMEMEMFCWINTSHFSTELIIQNKLPNISVGSESYSVSRTLYIFSIEI